MLTAHIHTKLDLFGALPTPQTTEDRSIFVNSLLILGEVKAQKSQMWKSHRYGIRPSE